MSRRAQCRISLKSTAIISISCLLCAAIIHVGFLEGGRVWARAAGAVVEDAEVWVLFRRLLLCTYLEAKNSIPVSILYS